MILLTYRTDSGTRLATRTAAGLFDTGHADIHELMSSGAAGRAQAEQGTGPALDESVLRLAPCVPHPGRIFCVGLNYQKHAEEAGMALPPTPVLFSKFGSCVAGSGEAIPLPGTASQYDYEAELAVVIGRRAHQVSEASALDHVWGYCNANDVSARDLQFASSQWLLGKALDKFLPLGPQLVSADAFPDLESRTIRCWVNGELRQDSSLGDMIFGVAEVVSYISRYIPLEPGDVISTGTPAGVIHGMETKNWLRPGDEVAVEIDGLGRLVNPLVSG